MGIMESVAGANLIFTLFILLVLAAVPKMDKKYSPAGRYVLWFILIIGLVLPFGAAILPHQPVFPITVNLHRAESSIEAPLPSEVFSLPAEQSPWISIPEASLPGQSLPFAPVISEAVETVEVSSPESRSIDVLQLLAIIWIAGIVISALYQFLRY